MIGLMNPLMIPEFLKMKSLTQILLMKGLDYPEDVEEEAFQSEDNYYWGSYVNRMDYFRADKFLVLEDDYEGYLAQYENELEEKRYRESLGYE